MRLPAKWSPLRWGGAIVLGLYRSVMLVGLTGAIPALGVAIGFFGSEIALSWSAQLTAPLIAVVLAIAGEVLMAAVWTAVAVWLAGRRAGRPLSQAARRLAERWLGVRLEVRYLPLPPVTRMATGYWWNGYEYHRVPGWATASVIRSCTGMLSGSPSGP
jgi:hypothetical protein